MIYWVCEADGAAKLQELVNQHIGKGWRPLGGLAAGCCFVAAWRAGGSA